MEKGIHEDKEEVQDSWEERKGEEERDKGGIGSFRDMTYLFNVMRRWRKITRIRIKI